MAQQYYGAQWSLLEIQYWLVEHHMLILHYQHLDEMPHYFLKDLHNVDKSDEVLEVELLQLVNLHVQQNYLAPLNDHLFSLIVHFEQIHVKRSPHFVHLTLPLDLDEQDLLY